MIVTLLVGVAVGFILAIAPGPVGVTILKSGLRGDQRSGALISFGASFLDFVYSLLAMLTATMFFGTLQALFVNHPIIMFFFQLFCIAAMIIYGFMQFRTTTLTQESTSARNPNSLIAFTTRLKKNGPFFLGVGIALANIANPTFLPSLTYTSMLVQHSSLIETTVLGSVVYSIGFGLGNFGWLYGLLRVVLHYRERFSPSLTIRIHRFAGATMIGAGAILGYRVLLLTKWTELLRFVVA
ncbi:MAG: LysE family transporter [Ignavibacteria bacterium]|nr:LysE family transporter [Ignavibacteria bacterium]